MKDKIIELNNGKNYYVLEDLTLDDKYYIYCSLVNEANETVDENNFVIVEVRKKVDGSYSLIDIEDENDIFLITNLFLNKIKKSEKKANI